MGFWSLRQESAGDTVAPWTTGAGFQLLKCGDLISVPFQKWATKNIILILMDEFIGDYTFSERFVGHIVTFPGFS